MRTLALALGAITRTACARIAAMGDASMDVATASGGVAMKWLRFVPVLALAGTAGCARIVTPHDASTIDSEAVDARDSDAMETSTDARDVVRDDGDASTQVFPDGCDPGPVPPLLYPPDPPYALTALDQHPALPVDTCSQPLGDPIVGDASVGGRRTQSWFVVREPVLAVFSRRRTRMLSVRTRCDDPSSALEPRIGADDGTDYFQYRLDPGTYYPIADQSTEVNFFRLAPNADCDTARDIPACTWIRSPHDRGWILDLQSGFEGLAIPMRAYRAEVHPNEVLYVRGGSWIAFDRDSWHWSRSSVFLGPFGDERSTVFRSSGDLVEVESMPAAVNRECDAASALRPGEIVRDIGGRAGVRPTRSCSLRPYDSRSLNPVSYTLYYAIDIPAHSVATLTAAHYAIAWLADTCEALCDRTTRSDALDGTLTVPNTGDAAIHRVVGVVTTGTDTAFTIAYTLASE